MGFEKRLIGLPLAMPSPGVVLRPRLKGKKVPDALAHMVMEAGSVGDLARVKSAGLHRVN